MIRASLAACIVALSRRSMTEFGADRTKVRSARGRRLSLLPVVKESKSEAFHRIGTSHAL